MPRVRDWIDPEGVPVSILTRDSRASGKTVYSLWKLPGSSGGIAISMTLCTS
jgi:hypothetical protein